MRNSRRSSRRGVGVGGAFRLRDMAWVTLGVSPVTGVTSLAAALAALRLMRAFALVLALNGRLTATA